MAIIQEGVNAEAQSFGVDIIDVRIKRADLPQANSEAIYKRMQTERQREAKEFRAKVLRWQLQLLQQQIKKLQFF